MDTPTVSKSAFDDAKQAYLTSDNTYNTYLFETPGSVQIDTGILVLVTPSLPEVFAFVYILAETVANSLNVPVGPVFLHFAAYVDLKKVKTEFHVKKVYKLEFALIGVSEI
ncbi:hypothetical protein ACWIGI_37465 [Nocardia sp. NPDC055321]